MIFDRSELSYYILAYIVVAKTNTKLKSTKLSSEQEWLSLRDSKHLYICYCK